MKVEKVYEGYQEILNNNLFLNTFSKDCKENAFNFYENNEELIIEVELNNTNTYSKYKQLHFNLQSNLPTELLIKDNTKKTSIRIIYNDIKIK